MCGVKAACSIRTRVRRRFFFRLEVIIIKLTATDYKKLKRRKRLKNDIKYKSHIKTLADNCQWYPSPAILIDEIWIKEIGYADNPKPYYKRLFRGRHKHNRYWFYKRYANRIVRRYKGELHSGGSYKKCFDYWWTVD